MKTLEAPCPAMFCSASMYFRASLPVLTGEQHHSVGVLADGLEHAHALADDGFGVGGEPPRTPPVHQRATTGHSALVRLPRTTSFRTPERHPGITARPPGLRHLPLFAGVPHLAHFPPKVQSAPCSVGCTSFSHATLQSTSVPRTRSSTSAAWASSPTSPAWWPCSRIRAAARRCSRSERKRRKCSDVRPGTSSSS